MALRVRAEQWSHLDDVGALETKQRDLAAVDRVQIAHRRGRVPAVAAMEQAAVLIALDVGGVAPRPVGAIADGLDTAHGEVAIELEHVIDVVEDALGVQHAAFDRVVGGAHDHAEAIPVCGNARVEDRPVRLGVEADLTDAHAGGECDQTIVAAAVGDPGARMALTKVLEPRAAVVLDLRRQVGPPQQRREVLPRLCGAADPGRRHRTLEPQPPFVDPAVDEEDVGGVGDVEPARGEHVRRREVAALAVLARQFVERLSPRRPPFPGLEQDSGRLRLRELRAQHALLKVRVEDLLVPAAELHPPAVIVDRQLAMPHVAIGLREVEDRARVARIAREIALEQSGVARELAPA